MRVAGHAVAAAHMREHAMVASDYAVKVINMLYPDHMDMVITERLWQIRHLKGVKQTDKHVLRRSSWNLKNCLII